MVSSVRSRGDSVAGWVTLTIRKFSFDDLLLFDPAGPFSALNYFVGKLFSELPVEAFLNC